MRKKENIKLVQPRPYQEIGARFIISGWVPKSWLTTDFGSVDDRVFVDFIDIDGQIFMGSSANIVADKSWLSKFRKKLKFHTVVQFNQFIVPSIVKSQGRITIKLSGHKDDCQLFLPLIVKSSNPDFKASSEIINRHGKVGEMVVQYEKDLKNYYRELEEIEKSRQLKDNIFKNKELNVYSYIQDWDIANGILDILENAKDPFKEYLYSEEDKREKELEEKYKNALDWRGPLFGVIIGKMNGFEFRIYSNDHGKHFHVIHREKGVNARFSFPEIELMNYKKFRNTISSKEKESIRKFFKDAKNFKKLDDAFKKMG